MIIIFNLWIWLTGNYGNDEEFLEYIIAIFLDLILW